MFRSLVLAALLHSTAFAADLDEDGCEDAYYNATAACVAPTADLGAGVIVGTGAFIGARASVGADSEIGANTVVGRTATVGARTVLAADSIIGRAATVGSDVDASAGGLSVSYAASIGDPCAVSSNVTLGSLVSVGADCEIGANTVLARAVTLGEGAMLGDGVVIGPEVLAGTGLDLADGVRVRKGITFGNGVTVGVGAAIGRNNPLGDGATIGAGATLRANVEVGLGVSVPENGVVQRGTALVNDVVDSCSDVFGVTCQQFEWDYLKASNTGGGDLFGHSVALSGDTLAVGAYRESSAATGVNGDQDSNSASDSGAVYVFVRSGGIWSQQAYLKASNTGASDRFGISLALSGDTLAVGAHLEDSAAAGVNGDQSSNATIDSGAVYVTRAP